MPVALAGAAAGRLAALPDFPWDALAPAAARARAHPGGVVDLSIGTPVDPTPELVQRALREASDAPGYPQTAGTPALREAVAAWAARVRGVRGLEPGAVLPTVGSKELVVWLPTLLGLGPGDAVALPAVAYPSYDVGARLAGARPVPVAAGPGVAERLAQAHAEHGPVRLVWVNSPSNPTGEVADVDELAGVVEWARSVGAVVASDECYAELPWDVDDVPSALDPRVCGTGHDGVLVLTSLSKRSNLAGYRAGAVLGDAALVAHLLQVRKHAGMMVPAPVQAAMAVAIADDEHVAVQRERYAARREVLRGALAAAGLAVEGSHAGLYLWARDGARGRAVGAVGAGGAAARGCWELVDALADQGVLVAPGAFYGEAARPFVRVALTAPDERVAVAAQRLARLGG